MSTTREASTADAKLLTISDMVDMCGFDRSYLIRECQNGSLPALRAADVWRMKWTNSANHWLVREDDFEEWMSNPRRGSMSKKKGVEVDTNQ